jgi:hypothetical protein
LSPEQVVVTRSRSLWIAWKGPNNVSPPASAHHFATLAADNKYKVTDDGDMKARCKPAEKLA